MLDKQKILEAAKEGIERYVEKYNDENGEQVGVLFGQPEESDLGMIIVDGGDVNGAWSLTLGEY